MKKIILSLFFIANFCYCQTNVASGKITEQSSTHGQGFSYKAVDGITNGSWNQNFPITHTEIGTNVWWKVDLGEIFNVSQIKIYNRVDCCSDRLTGAKIYAGHINSSNPNDYNLLVTTLNSNNIQEVNLNITTRYIMIYLEGSNKILSLDEVKVYGIQLSASTTDLWSQSGTNIFYNTGNVGIGITDTKGFKLGVLGKLAAEEVKVAVYNNWADFVFESNYNLPTLKEVEQHIKEKGHLKDIPSAKDVKENGIFLGEMDSKLLQKIEELTLYAIDQEKRIETLEAKNEKLIALLEALLNKKD